MENKIVPVRITIVTSYYVPENTSNSKYYENLANDLADHDTKVTVVCGIPTRLVIKEITKQYSMNLVEHINENLQIVRTGPKKNEGRSLLVRSLYHIYRSWCIYKKAKNTETDIYFVCSTPPFFGIYGAWLSKHTKTIYDLQDIFPDTLVSSGKANEKSLLVKVFRKIEKYIYKHNTYIRVISQDMAATLKARGVPDRKISLIYNWVDENEVTYIERQDNPMFDMLQIPREGFYVCYAGNIGLLQNLSTLIDAAEILKEKEPQIQFIVIGDGAWKSEMLKQIHQKHLLNIRVYPMQEAKYVPYVYNLADIGVVTVTKGVSKGSMPSKTWAIMSASHPVICETDEGSELENIIKKNDCGLCISPGDSEDFTAKVLQLYHSREMIVNMGNNARTYVENNITRKESTRKILECIMNAKIEE